VTLGGSLDEMVAGLSNSPMFDELTRNPSGCDCENSGPKPVKLCSEKEMAEQYRHGK